MPKKEYRELTNHFPVCIHYIALSRRVNHAKSKKNHHNNAPLLHC